MKSIAEALVHRDCRSTAQYLRLDLDVLRAVGLRVPESAAPVQLLTGDWQAGFPRVRIEAGPWPRSDGRFRSAFGPAIERFITTRRTLGRKYVTEEDYLRAWDAFLHREKAKTMNRTVFDRWAKSIRHLPQKTQASQLYSVRSFLAYYAREHPTCFVPDSACFAKQLPRRLPRLADQPGVILETALVAGLVREDEECHAVIAFLALDALAMNPLRRFPRGGRRFQRLGRGSGASATGRCIRAPNNLQP